MTDEILTTRTERSNGSLIIHLSGEIDLSNATQLREQLETTITGWPDVTIDLTEIQYLDSQALRLIKQLIATTDENGTKLRLVAPPDSFPRQLLELSQTNDYIEIRDTLEP